MFNRSIQVLTPERAFKFTAMSQENHYKWLHALSYLASVDFMEQNPLASTTFSVPSPVPPSEELRPLSPAVASLRATKGKRPFAKGSAHSYPSLPIGMPETDGAAEPPHVPRLTAQTRKRSYTGPKPPQGIGFRPFSSQSGAGYPSPELGLPGLSHAGPGTVQMDAFVRQSVGRRPPPSSRGGRRHEEKRGEGTVEEKEEGEEREMFRGF